MGKNNRARRAAKSRKRTARGTPRSRGERNSYAEASDPFGQPWFGDAPGEPDLVAGLWIELLQASSTTPDEVPSLLRLLERRPESIVSDQAQSLLIGLVSDLWQRGWQPAELRRMVRIEAGAQAAALCELAVHADHARRPGQALDPRWAAQIDDLGGHRLSTQGRWLTGWREQRGITPIEMYRLVVEVCRLGSGLPPLDLLIPPPGASPSVVTAGAPARANDQHPVLDRVRKLLAKAESTDFEDEAATFTAKAQELMTRYAIDEALLHSHDPGDVPRMARIPIDAPYADAKSMLLGVVAGANRCRAVYLTGLHMSTVLGYADDLAVVELLFTSLLVQAQKSLTEAGRGQPGGRARSASFRASFLLAYASRIGERLAGVNSATLHEDRGMSALPVLRAREHAVEDLLNDRYGGSLTSGSVRGGYDYLGQVHGRRAADEAKLDAGAIVG